MQEFNANAGFVDIAGLATRNQNLKQQQQNQLFSNIGGLADNLKEGFEKEAIDEAIRKNFNKETNELDQKGVVSSLFESNPQKALELQQAYKQQQMAQSKQDAEIGKENALTNKYNLEQNKIEKETVIKDLEFKKKSIEQFARQISGIDPNNPNAQNRYEMIVSQAKQQGYPVESYEGQQFTPELRKEIIGIIYSYDKEVDDNLNREKNEYAQVLKNAQLGISQQKTDIQQQNANTNEFKAQNMANKEANQPMSEYQKQSIALKERELGGKEEAKANKEATAIEEGTSKLNGALSKLTEYNSNINDLINNPAIRQPKASLLVGSSKFNPLNTEANKFRSLYENFVKSTIATSLATIKSESSTGASGFGQLTEKELPIIAAAGGAYDWDSFINLDPETRISVLNKVIAKGVDTQKNIENKINKNNMKLQDYIQQPQQASQGVQPQATNTAPIQQESADEKFARIQKLRGD